METALDVAREEIERGAREIGGNNDGPFVEKYHGAVDGEHPWCAAFCCWVFEEASRRTGVQLPFERTGSAKALFKRACRAGRKTSSASVGSLVGWTRGDPTSWTGHIGIVSRIVGPDTFYAIEGNVGSYSRTQGRVREIMHRVDDERLLGFAVLEER